MPIIRALDEREWARSRSIRLRALRDCHNAFGATLEQELISVPLSGPSDFIAGLWVDYGPART